MMDERNAELSKAITQIGSCIIIALPAELTDESIGGISHAFAENAYDSRVTGAILNFSKVIMMDTYVFNEMRKLSKAIALMGVRVVWAGLSPGVICALVDLGVELSDKKIATVGTLDQGLALLSQ